MENNEEEEDEEEKLVLISPDLIESDLFRGAIPILSVPVAIVCCVVNVFVPGLGTILSGLFCFFFCCGPGPRFSQPPSDPDSCNFEKRLAALFVNLLAGILQLFTVLFFLVGWCWAVGWGITLVMVAKKNEDFLNEQYRQRCRRFGRRRLSNNRIDVDLNIEESNSNINNNYNESRRSSIDSAAGIQVLHP